MRFESFAESWKLRFDTDPPDIPLADHFLSHRSVRDYSDRTVDEALVAVLIGAAQSASTSSNLQLWSVISIQDPERRASIFEASATQRQILGAAWVFAFVADHFRLRKAAINSKQTPDGLDYSEFFIMSVIDCALAAERMVCAAESLGLGASYVGSFRNNPQEIKKILQLPQYTFVPFGVCIGYPAENAANIKPRLNQASVWFREKYVENVDVDEYDTRMAEFYYNEGMRGDITWSMRSGRRVDEHHLTGREVLLGWLQTQGFNLR
jgi:nitroreductase